jgi:hypothetical protein
LFATVLPVKVCVVEVPAESVTVSVTVNGPEVEYVWEVVAVELVGEVLPSPKFQA